VLFCDGGFVPIDYKRHSGEQTSLQEAAASYAGQLRAYRTAIETAVGGECLGTFGCFPLRGQMVEVHVAG